MRLLQALLATAVLALAPQAGRAAAFSPTPARHVVPIRSPDGVTFMAYEWGTPTGRPIVFVHGSYQSALTWAHQTSDPALAARYRLIAIDLRGHGASDKPDGAEYYRDGRRWAGDLTALFDTLHIDRPVVVSWSYGARVINDYLVEHGDGRLAGLVYVGARSTPGPAGDRPDDGVMAASRNLSSTDPATFMLGTRQFLLACYETPPGAEEVEMLTLASMQTPLYVRTQMSGRSLAYVDALKAIHVPALVVQGEKDRIVPAAIGDVTHGLIPGSRYALYPGVGHAVFAEQPARFNQELDVFVAGLK
jgi:pimeloyl-ACP methyl ester carboxylesterase